MFNRLCPPNFGRKKLAIFAKNIAQGKNVTQNFGNRWASSNMQATVWPRIVTSDPIAFQSNSTHLNGNAESSSHHRTNQHN